MGCELVGNHSIERQTSTYVVPVAKTDCGTDVAVVTLGVLVVNVRENPVELEVEAEAVEVMVFG